MTGGWGYFLIQGVRDPLGGINSLWPLFGIANQLLAAIALCLATTVILKMQLAPGAGAVVSAQSGAIARRSRPAFALITLLPLLWLLSVTVTAGVQKIFHPNPQIGFLASARDLDEKLPVLQQALELAKNTGGAAMIGAAEKALHTNRVLHFNWMLDSAVTAGFLIMVVLIVVLSVREWVLLLARRKLARLCETEPVWLPDYALVESRPLHVFGLLALAIGLLKELSGEAAIERAQQQHLACACMEHGPGGILVSAKIRSGAKENARRGKIYAQMAERRFKGVTRCC
jgi:carbon starvation protein